MPSLRRISRWTRSSRRYGASSPKTSGRAAPGRAAFPPASRPSRHPVALASRPWRSNERAADGPREAAQAPAEPAGANDVLDLTDALDEDGGVRRSRRSDCRRRAGRAGHPPPPVETEAAEPIAAEPKPAEASPRTDRPPPAEASPESDRAADPGPRLRRLPPTASRRKRRAACLGCRRAGRRDGVRASGRAPREFGGSRRWSADRPLDEIVRDLLRPLLQTWLDENLPGIVERLVAGGNRQDFGPLRAGLSRSAGGAGSRRGRIRRRLGIADSISGCF